MKNKFCVFTLVLSLLLISAVVPASADSTTGSAVRTRMLSSTLRSAASLSWHDNFSSDDPLVYTSDSDDFMFVRPNTYFSNPLFIPCYFIDTYNGSSYVYFAVFSIADYVGSISDSHRVSITLGNSIHYFNQSYSYNDLDFIGFPYRVGASGSVSLNSSFPVYSSPSDMTAAVGSFISSSVSASVHWTNGSVATPLFASDTPTFTVSSSVADPAYVLCASLPDINNVSVTLVASTSQYVDTSSTIDISDGRSLALSNTFSVGGYTFLYRNPNSGTSGILSPNPDFPYFDTVADAFAAFAEFLDSMQPTSSFTLPYGNVLYLDLGVGSDYDLILSSSMPEISSLVGDPWPDSQYYFFADSLPTLDTYFYPSDGTYLAWQKGDDRNFFGQTYTAITRLSGTAAHRYLAIINPFDYANSSTVTFGQYVTNGSVKVERISSGTTIYSYPLFSEFSNGVVTSVISDTNGGTGTAASSGGTIQTVTINDNSVDYSSPDGGGNMSSVAESTQSLIQKLRDTLKSFFDSILELLGKPIEHIQSLINAGSAFFQELSGLWSWLPEEVSGILTSTLIIMVAVAVFKVFL